VGTAELQEAVERVVAGMEKKNRVLGPRERERVAHHEVGHALVALLLPGLDTVRKISIIPRGVAALGYTLQMPAEDRFVVTQAELEAKIAMLLGGRAAEELVFGDLSTGAQDDLLKATAIARSMVRAYGMSPKLGDVSFERDHGPLWIRADGDGEARDFSDETAQLMDAEVHRILETQHERARDLLRARSDLVREAAAALQARETLEGSELAAMLAARN
jgi:cell division protease FtsH